ncbi:hypothetical protein [Acidipropionibacterium jensenii]|uniref:hypothetical protein n=1 Tax=Acidipropionibacterium jensenii TaxID=1749 RepID=UPI00214BC128|nr:hypothetical protein [Acidipropionibacterium jensenii]
MPSFIELAAVEVAGAESGEVRVLEEDVEPDDVVEPEDCVPDEPSDVIETCGAEEPLGAVPRREA